MQKVEPFLGATTKRSVGVAGELPDGVLETVDEDVE